MTNPDEGDAQRRLEKMFSQTLGQECRTVAACKRIACLPKEVPDKDHDEKDVLLVGQ